MELSEVRGAEENRVMKETMNEKDFIELMNKVKELDPERYRFTIYTLGLRESGAEEEDIHYLANRPELIRAFEKIVKKYENLNMLQIENVG